MIEAESELAAMVRASGVYLPDLSTGRGGGDGLRRYR
jgi:hypothetical protein